MAAPTLTIWLYFIALGMASGMSPGNQLPKRADLAASVGLAFVISYWVISDARKRGYRLCYDYDSFVYFAWPLVVPIYLFRTRGIRAFLTLLCFGGVCLTAAAIGFVMMPVRGFLR
jgi:hypothetical protein